MAARSGSPRTSSFDGPVHTNGEFRFAHEPYFGDRVSSVNGKAWFYNDGCSGRACRGPQRQHRRALLPWRLHPRGLDHRDADGHLLPAVRRTGAEFGHGTAPTNAQIRFALGLNQGSTAPPNDVYLVSNDGINVTGGIYVQGDLTRCTMRVDGAGNQVYVLTQGTSTDSIRVNRTTTRPSSTTPPTRPARCTPACRSGASIRPATSSTCGAPIGWVAGQRAHVRIVILNDRAGGADYAPSRCAVTGPVSSSPPSVR